MRANIFERLQQSGYDVKYEINKLHNMFTEQIYEVVQESIYHTPTERCSVERAVDMFAFHAWKQRHSLLSLDELKRKIGIKDFIMTIRKNALKVNEHANEIILYVEYMINILMLAKRMLNNSKHACDLKNYIIRFDNAKIKMILQNINIFLDNTNLESHSMGGDEKFILVEKNATVTAVAEIVSDDLLYPVIEYNHHLLQGNIIRKREILKKFADDLEPKRKELKNLQKAAEDSLFYMFNKLNIRHNNNDIKEVANMGEEELESWYDEIYQLVLYCYLILDNNPRIAKLKDLQNKIENR